MRLIDVRKAIEDAEDDASFKDGLGTVRDVQMFLDGQEPVNAVSVVYCQDCKKFKLYKCPLYNKAQPWDFCSYGERREVKDDGKL